MNDAMTSAEKAVFFSKQSYALLMTKAQQSQDQQPGLAQETQGQSEAEQQAVTPQSGLPVVRVFKNSKDELFVGTTFVRADRGARRPDDVLQSKGDDLVLVDELFADDLPQLVAPLKMSALEIINESKGMAMRLRKKRNMMEKARTETSIGSHEVIVPSIENIIAIAHERAANNKQTRRLQFA